VRRIIDGVAYDTETATFIASGEADPDHLTGSQASWSLYRTRHGAWFEVVAGHDGVLEEFNPLTDDEARRFLEVNANSLLEKFFGRMPEAGQGKNVQERAFELLQSIERATRGSSAPVVIEELRDLHMTADEAKEAFHYLKGKGLIEAKFSIFYAARLAPAGHDAIQSQITARAAPVRQKAVAPDPIRAAPASPPELLTLRPGIWGINIDLKEAGRRIRQLWEKGRNRG